MEIKLKGYEVLSFEEEVTDIKDDDGYVIVTQRRDRTGFTDIDINELIDKLISFNDKFNMPNDIFNYKKRCN